MPDVLTSLMVATLLNLLLWISIPSFLRTALWKWKDGIDKFWPYFLVRPESYWLNQEFDGFYKKILLVWCRLLFRYSLLCKYIPTLIHHSGIIISRKITLTLWHCLSERLIEARKPIFVYILKSAYLEEETYILLAQISTLYLRILNSNQELLV